MEIPKNWTSLKDETETCGKLMAEPKKLVKIKKGR
jgi:hypothetical protein